MKTRDQAKLQSMQKPEQRQQQRMKRRAQVQLQSIMRKPEQLEQQGMKRRAQEQLAPFDAETGTTAATRNQKATVTGKTPRAEAGTMTAIAACGVSIPLNWWRSIARCGPLLEASAWSPPLYI